MSISRLNIKFSTDNRPSDLRECIGMACYKNARRAFGYVKVTLPTKNQKTTTEKVKASVKRIFIFLLTLPVSVPLTLLGMLCLSLSRTHKEKYKEAFQRSNPEKKDKPKPAPVSHPPQYSSPALQFSQNLFLLAKSIASTVSKEEKMGHIAEYSNKIRGMTELKVDKPKQHHLLHYALCKVSDQVAHESKVVKEKWQEILNLLKEVTIIYPDSKCHPSLTVRVKVDTEIAKERVEGKKPAPVFEKLTRPNGKHYEKVLRIQRMSFPEDHRHICSINDVSGLTIARDQTRNNEIVGFVHYKEEGGQQACCAGWKPSLGMFRMNFPVQERA